MSAGWWTSYSFLHYIRPASLLEEEKILYNRYVNHLVHASTKSDKSTRIDYVKSQDSRRDECVLRAVSNLIRDNKSGASAAGNDLSVRLGLKR